MVKLKTDDTEQITDTHHDEGRGSDVRYAAREHAVVDEGLQRQQYGGFHIGPAFFGWLVASGLATMLLTLLAAAGTTLTLTKLQNVSILSVDRVTIGLLGGIVLAAVVFLAYYAGGYVAGRMARFDGARQGVGVWVIGVLVTLLLGAAADVLGAKYNILGQLHLPYIPVNGESFTTAGLLTTLIALGVTLLGAWLGGKAGTHYHRKVDAAGTVEHTLFAPRRHAPGH